MGLTARPEYVIMRSDSWEICFLEKKVKLLSKGTSNVKTSKSDKSDAGYLTMIMYLAPYNLSGTNLCPKSSNGCRHSCLFTAGFAGMYVRINERRIAKTKYYLQNRSDFKTQLLKELSNFEKLCKRKNKKPCVRLNGTSDIVWEKVMPEIFTKFPTIQFYDYTKIARRFDKPLPSNYYLVFSRHETNENDCKEVLKKGHNITVVFSHKKPFPKKFWGYNVVSGDDTDLRFLDKKGVVVALKAKGKARKDKSGFVIW